MKSKICAALFSGIIGFSNTHCADAQSISHFITYQDATRGSLDGLIDTLKWYSEQQGVNKRHQELLALERERLMVLNEKRMRVEAEPATTRAGPPDEESMSRDRVLLDENRYLREQVHALSQQVASLTRIIEAMAERDSASHGKARVEEVDSTSDNDPLGLRR